MNHPMTLAWAFDIWTYLIVGIVALLIFGNRLPEVGRSLGRGIAEFKKGLRDVADEVGQEEPREPPPKPKLRAPEAQASEPAQRQLPASEAPSPTQASEQRPADK